MKGQKLNKITFKGILSAFYDLDGQFIHPGIKNPSEWLKTNFNQIMHYKGGGNIFFSVNYLQLSEFIPNFAAQNLIIVRVVMTLQHTALPAVCQRWALFLF